MTLEQYLALKDSVYQEARRLSTTKSNDYSDHADVLMNFRRGAAMFGMTIETVLKTRLADKLSRLHQLASKSAMVDESIADTVCDAHNYLDLLYAAMLETREPE